MSSFPNSRLVFALLAACLASPSLAQGQGWIQPDQSFPGFAVERVRTHVQIRVVDRIAQVEVEEWFHNRGGRLEEGIYLYPLPGETVFQNYSLFQGDLELTGETMDASQARSIYEEIVRRRKDPALIELVGHGLLRARVFPIGAGETRRITLRYTQILERAGEVLELRYAAGGAGRAGASGVTRPRPAQQSTPLTFTVTVEEEERFLDPFSPTHELTVDRGNGEIRIRPSDELSGSFVLFLPPAGQAVRLALSTHRPSSEDGYFMLNLSPGEVGESAMPRDLTMVVDVSGSMSGVKLEQTRRALSQLLGTLGTGDRFRLIRFSSGVASYALGWTPAGGEEVERARAWVGRLRADGGTNISGALDEAFSESSPEGRLPVLIFLTDGLPTAGETNPEAIADLADRLRGRARVFAFGVGYDVDTYLLDRLTMAGRGGVQYVGPGEDVERALGLLAMKIQHPVLAELEWGRVPVRISDVYPTKLPDLFVGEELTVFGRYAGTGRGELSINGEREGRVASFSAEVMFSEHETENEFIPRLWAARKIGELTREVRVNGSHPELIDEIRQTALRYGILTEYTSYLVLEPDMIAGEGGLRPPEVRQELPRAGRDAVLGAAAASRAREANRADDVAEMERMALNAAQAQTTATLVSVSGSVGQRAVGVAPELSVVAGRAFVLRDGVWVDRMHSPDARTMEVQAFSPAYFELLSALPELEAWLSEFSSIIVAGEELSLRITESGASSLSSSEIQRVVREFRGS